MTMMLTRMLTMILGLRAHEYDNDDDDDDDDDEDVHILPSDLYTART